MSSCFKEIYIKHCVMLRHCVYNSQIIHVCVCERVNMVHNLQFVDDIWEKLGEKDSEGL